MERRWYKNSFIVIFWGLLICGLFSMKTYASEIPESEFEDKKLYQLMLNRYDFDGDGILETEEAEQVLYIEIFPSIHIKEVTSFKGLEYFKNVYNINFDGTGFKKVKDISPICELTNLQFLSIEDLTRVEDWSGLNKLINLQQIVVDGCDITDISFLRNMPHMKTLVLGTTEPISNVQIIGELKELVSINIPGGSCTDISFLSGLDKLESVDITGNIISDFTPLLSSVETLNSLVITTTVKDSNVDLSILSMFTKLETLYMDNNNIDKMPDLTKLTKLKVLHVWDNYLDIEDIVKYMPESAKQYDDWIEYTGLYHQKIKEEELNQSNGPNATTNINIMTKLDDGVYYEATDETKSDTYESVKKQALIQHTDGKVAEVYDVCLYTKRLVDGSVEVIKVQPSGDVEIAIPIKDRQAYTYYVYRQEDDGSLVLLDSTYDELAGMLYFRTNHFSIFCVVGVGDAPEKTTNEDTTTDHIELDDTTIEATTEQDVTTDMRETGTSKEEYTTQDENTTSMFLEQIETEEEMEEPDDKKAKHSIWEMVPVILVVIGIVIYEIIKRRKVTLIVLLFLLTYFCMTENVWAAEIPMSEFDNKNLYDMVLEQCDENEDGLLDEDEAKYAEDLNLSMLTYDETIYEGGMESLKGLEYFENLKSLIIQGETSIQLKDISALSALYKLELLVIKLQFNIEDFTLLANLTNLSYLEMHTNVEDISFLKNLTKLEHLSLHGCAYITDGKTIGNLLELKWLEISETRIIDVNFLKNCSKLETLIASSCPIYDFGILIEHADTLKYLSIGNYHTDFSLQYVNENLTFLEKMTALENLYILDSHLLDIPNLTGLTKLESLGLALNHLDIEKVVHKLPMRIFQNPEWREDCGFNSQEEYDPENIILRNSLLEDNDVEIEGKFAKDAYVVATEEEHDEHTDVVKYVQSIAGEDASINIYDITTYKYYQLGESQYGRTEKSQPYEAVEVTVPMKYDSGFIYYAFRQEDNGDIITLECSVKNGKVTFYTDHFCIFSVAAVVMINEDVAADIDIGDISLEDSIVNDKENRLWFDIVALVGIVTVVVACEVFRRRKRR